MRILMIIAMLTLAGCHGYAGRWATCVHEYRDYCAGIRPVLAVP